jgi:molybdate transport system substrate-binding protein
MKYTFLLVFFCLIACLSQAQKVRIAVAANAQFVSQKLKEAFKKETGIDANLTVGSSGKLTAQIEQGAPFDVFLSADMKYPQELFTKSLTTAKPAVYAYGTLVLWSFKKRDFSKGLATVLNSDINRIAVANPKLAPYGEATIAALTKQNLLQKAQPKIVYGESISQVNQYLLSGAAEVAFTAKSVVLDTAMAGKGTWIEVNKSLYKPIEQGVIIIKNSANVAAAQKFYQFLFSSKAKAIFSKYGYK